MREPLIRKPVEAQVVLHLAYMPEILKTDHTQEAGDYLLHTREDLIIGDQDRWMAISETVLQFDGNHIPGYTGQKLKQGGLLK
jgi:hypothetical protein